jgi:hypothetical protein
VLEDGIGAIGGVGTGGAGVDQNVGELRRAVVVERQGLGLDLVDQDVDVGIGVGLLAAGVVEEGRPHGRPGNAVDPETVLGLERLNRRLGDLVDRALDPL